MDVKQNPLDTSYLEQLKIELKHFSLLHLKSNIIPARLSGSVPASLQSVRLSGQVMDEVTVEDVAFAVWIAHAVGADELRHVDIACKGQL